ncbi:MAG: membrane dipeptidase, partial [Bacteroidetes bacterium]|nr:membrane dipeptidase [Bacteroidota bacterium]
MKHAILIVLLFGCVGCTASRPASDTDLKARSTVLTHRFILIDTHVDTPYRLREETDDISIRSSGNFDYVKAREGGLNAPFMSIYIPSSYEQDGGAKLLADTLIAMVESWSREHPEKFEVATSVADVRRISASSK